jgi:hypothetical protein
VIVFLAVVKLHVERFRQFSRSIQDSISVSDTVASATRARAASSMDRNLSTYQAWAMRSIPAPTSGAVVRSASERERALAAPSTRSRPQLNRSVRRQ